MGAVASRSQRSEGEKLGRGRERGRQTDRGGERMEGAPRRRCRRGEVWNVASQLGESEREE